MSIRLQEPLFILEMANNHMGDVAHGIRIVREFANVCKEFPFKFAVKMQYRHLDTLIHPDFIGREDIKYIKRFSETRLSREDARRLVAEIKACGFIAICTPFDEASVDLIIEDGFDVLKVASCSLTDWPLWEKIAKNNLPVVASVGGAGVADIDNVVTFLANRNREFALMHCIAEYPTPTNKLELNQIDFLRRRYPGVPIGYSTHEDPALVLPAAIAIAKGCRIFEKHVGVPTDKYAINNYSATPNQVRAWLEAARDAIAVCGLEGERVKATSAETANLFSLRRGVYARAPIAAGDRIGPQNTVLAIPTQEGHLTANDLSKYNHAHALIDIPAGAPVLAEAVRIKSIRPEIEDIGVKVKALLRDGAIVVPGHAELEISHHYGLERFFEYGVTMVTVVNREYCKKLIVVLAGQKHPTQYHKLKEETFHILHGRVKLTLDGVVNEYGPGAVVTVGRGVHHAFESDEGAVFEEISSTHHQNDSFYVDERINQSPNRKTILSYWL